VYQFGTATGPTTRGVPWHGIGIAAPTGTPVRAIAGGTVSLAGPLGTYLTSVLVDHGGGYYSFYGSLNDATVTHGERSPKGRSSGMWERVERSGAPPALRDPPPGRESPWIPSTG